MWSTHLKITLRSLKRHAGHTALSVLGLAVGLAAATILLLFVWQQRSHDAFHEQAEHLYRIGSHQTRPTGERQYYSTRMPALPTLIAEMPEVKTGTRVRGWTHWFGHSERRLQGSITYVDSTFLDTFSFEVLDGDADAALARPGYVLVTPSTAEQFFGDDDPIGKRLDVDFGESAYVVSGVVAEPPRSSEIQFEMLAYRGNIQGFLDQVGSWYNGNTTAYVRLRPNADFADVQAKLPAFVDRHFAPYESTEVQMTLTPLVGLRAAMYDLGALLMLLSGIAGAVLLIAAINFTNLATARSMTRAQEIGTRKVLGARRRQLAGQFLGESLGVSFAALVLSVGLVASALPALNTMLGEGIDLGLTLSLAEHGPMLLTLGVGVGLAAGLYPALYLSGFRPIEALRGRLAQQPKGRRLQQGLVVIQFTASVALIIAAMVMWQQIDYMKEQDLGFDQENIVVMPMHREAFDSVAVATARYRSFQRRLLQDTRVVEAAFSNVVPGRYNNDWNTYHPEGEASSDGVRIRQSYVGAHYFDTYGIDLITGQPFRETDAGPPEGVQETIINEAAARAAGWTPDEAVGRRFRAGGSDRQVVVRGVVSNFHYRSLQDDVEPLLHYQSGALGYAPFLSVRLAPGPVNEGLDLLRREWARLYASLPFEYRFADETFDNQYRIQESVGYLAAGFSVIATVLACLGLFGLAAFAVQQRTKEVGIRKVLGASIASIVGLLSKDFLKLVAVAVVLAAPPAYWAMSRWLADFAYRIALGPTVFVGAGVLALTIAFSTVSYHAVRAALADPTKAIQHE